MEAGGAEAAFQERGAQLITEIENYCKNQKASTQVDIDLKSPNTAINKFCLLTVCHMIVQWRNPGYCFKRIISLILMSFYMGLLFVGNKQVIIEWGCFRH